MDSGTFQGIITGVLILAFLGITAWAYSKRRKPDFDEAANLPFADDDEPAPHHRQDSPDNRTARADSRDKQGDKNA
jgi:cytochrome c oxidase cbb3-type subunit 4